MKQSSEFMDKIRAGDSDSINFAQRLVLQRYIILEFKDKSECAFSKPPPGDAIYIREVYTNCPLVLEDIPKTTKRLVEKIPSGD